MKKEKSNGNNKIKLWDIESTNLSADFGYILSIAVKDLGDNKVRCYRIDDYKLYKKDPTNDRELLREASADLSDAGAWVTWYGSRFDVPMVNSRLLYHGLNPMPPVPHIDGWRVAKYKMALHSNRLASVSSFLELEEKTPLDGPIWIKASAGDKKALAYIVEHNVQDVVVLEEAFNRIKPLITNGPNLSLLDASVKRADNRCPICSSGPLHRRGVSITTTGRRQRFQCQSCGGWSSGKVER